MEVWGSFFAAFFPRTDLSAAQRKDLGGQRTDAILTKLGARSRREAAEWAEHRELPRGEVVGAPPSAVLRRTADAVRILRWYLTIVPAAAFHDQPKWQP